MKIQRKHTRKIHVGAVPVGGGAPIAVQSMTNTDTADVGSTVRQIKRLQRAGCEIIRISVPNRAAARALSQIRSRIAIPLVADIHFDHRLALASLENGVDGLRVNPGTIGNRNKVREVTREAIARNVPIRIGVNAGSLEKDLLAKYGGPTPEAMVRSALGQVKILESEGFDLIKISLKASDVPRTVDAYRLLSRTVDYPLHLGITEAGTLVPGAVKSAVGIGLLLAEGIGDTIRVSLTARPEEEIRVAYGILGSLGIRQRGVELISCPTCSRTEIDLLRLASKVQRAVATIQTPLKVAVMGCAVNGPGEAKEADVGIAAGRKKGVLFKKGRSVGTCEEMDLLPALLFEIEKMTGEKVRFARRAKRMS
jgi:(E)-4-hydroxy-3-methylbut-2-enyl-diphosphate synthase